MIIIRIDDVHTYKHDGNSLYEFRDNISIHNSKSKNFVVTLHSFYHIRKYQQNIIHTI